LRIVKQRAIGAIVGAAVSDAATRPFHWVYNRDTIEDILNNGNPEFWPSNNSPYYDLPTGFRSCYNDVGFVMLQSLPVGSIDTISEFLNEKKFIEEMLSFFSPSSEYAQALKRRKEVYDSSKYAMVLRLCSTVYLCIVIKIFLLL
jgi:hypothetical protein